MLRERQAEDPPRMRGEASETNIDRKIDLKLKNAYVKSVLAAKSWQDILPIIREK